MKLSVIIESIASAMTSEPCEITLQNGYFKIHNENLVLEVTSCEVTIRKQIGFPVKGFDPEQMAEIHSLWRLINWKQVEELTWNLDSMPPYYLINTKIIDKINMFKKLLFQSGLSEWKQFKQFYETEYRY